MCIVLGSTMNGKIKLNNIRKTYTLNNRNRNIPTYLSSCDRKVCKYTVFLIFMASIGFQTFSLAIVPKF